MDATTAVAVAVMSSLLELFAALVMLTEVVVLADLVAVVWEVLLLAVGLAELLAASPLNAELLAHLLSLQAVATLVGLVELLTWASIPRPSKSVEALAVEAVRLKLGVVFFVYNPASVMKGRFATERSKGEAICTWAPFVQA